eukprot:16452390-Heterocapsa_arctica.AAC.1
MVASLLALKPLKPQELWDIIRRIGIGKAVGMDAWGPAELKALPWEAVVELTDVLNQIEGESGRPEGLRGALVAPLPKQKRSLAFGPKTHQSAPLCVQALGGGEGPHP